jgi:hypothetical protein
MCIVKNLKFNKYIYDMKHLLVYEKTALKYEEEKELLIIFEKILSSNSFTFNKSKYSNNILYVEFANNLTDIASISQYYQSLLTLLKPFNIRIETTISKIFDRLTFTFTEESWKELKFRKESDKFNL